MLLFISSATDSWPPSPRSGRALGVSSRSPFEIVLTKQERAFLEHLARQGTASYRNVVRARIILFAAAGLDNAAIGAHLCTPRDRVSRWRKRFFEQRLAGLEDRQRTGRPVRFSPQGCGRD